VYHLYVAPVPSVPPPTINIVDSPEKMFVGAEIDVGILERVFMESVAVRAILFPQKLVATTLIVPPVVPAVVEIELVVEEPDQPEGRVHEYDVAPETAATEYVCVPEGQTPKLPVNEPGCSGTGVEVTLKVLAGPAPQALFATTEIFPPPGPTNDVILVVVEFPVHPVGSVQV
jgi:hypothetical protein